MAAENKYLVFITDEFAKIVKDLYEGKLVLEIKNAKAINCSRLNSQSTFCEIDANLLKDGEETLILNLFVPYRHILYYQYVEDPDKSVKLGFSLS